MQLLKSYSRTAMSRRLDCEHCNSTLSLLSLPHEVLLNITSNLDPSSYRSLLLTHSTFARFFSADMHTFTTLTCARLTTSTSTPRQRTFSLTNPDPDCIPALTALLLAAIHKDASLVTHILRHSAGLKIGCSNAFKINHPYITYTTPLSSPELAAVTTHLLSVGPGALLSCAICNSTPIHVAAANSEKALRFLLSYGVPDRGDHRGNFALHYAAEDGNKTIVKMLVEAGGSEDDLNAATNSALHIAVKKGNTDTVRFLIVEHGWSPNKLGYWGHAPLHCAVVRVDISMIRLLLSLGADPTQLDAHGKLAADIAWAGVGPGGCGGRVRGVMFQAVKILEGADIYARCPDGQTALHRAARNGNRDMLRRLLNSGAEIDVVDGKGNTPLHLAATAGEEVLFELLNRGADTTIVNFEGKMAVDVANEECTKFLWGFGIE